MPTDRGDVLDRSLVVELERIPDGERKTEDELWESFEAEHPRLLGALFGVLSEAIAPKPSLKLSRRPRLADWGEYAAAVYEVLGWGAEQFLDDWDEIVKVQNQSTLDGSPVAQAVIKFMDGRDEYTATSSELHKKLGVIAEELGVGRDKAWPKSAAWLWKRIREVLPLLIAAGIEVDRIEDKSGSKIVLRKIPKNAATATTESESGIGKAKSDGSKAKTATTRAATTDSSTATGGSTGGSSVSDATTEKPRTYEDFTDGGSSGSRRGGTWENDPLRFYSGIGGGAV